MDRSAADGGSGGVSGPNGRTRTTSSQSGLIGLSLSLLVPLLLAACGDGGNGSRMMRMMGQQSMELPDGVPAADLPAPESRGARLAARYCSQCHGIPSPRRHAAEDWEATARRMFRRMDHMEHMGGMMGRGMRRGMMDVEAPTGAEEREILTYLRQHAMRGVRAGALPAGEGREAFERVCSRCHALPDPGQHTPAEWSAVMERMRGHMERMEVEEITDSEAERVVRYLQRAASDSAR